MDTLRSRRPLTDYLSLNMMGVSGRVAVLTFQVRGERVEIWVNAAQVTSIDRDTLRCWLALPGARRPLHAPLLHLSSEDLGVRLEVYDRVAPSVVEQYLVDRLLAVLR